MLNIIMINLRCRGTIILKFVCMRNYEPFLPLEAKKLVPGKMGIFLTMKMTTAKKIEAKEVRYGRVQRQNLEDGNLKSGPARLNSIFYFGKAGRETLLSRHFWDVSKEVKIAKKCKDGRSFAKKAFVRSRWDCENLYFYAELEEESVINDDSCLWKGTNLEILISPSGTVVPFMDEYEFLFNSNGSVNTLRWYDKSDLETSLQWQCSDLESFITTNPLFQCDKCGYAVFIKMPFVIFEQKAPVFGESWRLGLYRKIRSETDTAFLAWIPTLTDPPEFHVPVKFGHLMFVKNN